jgi:transaldolase
LRKLSDLAIKVYADGANKEDILEQYKNPIVKGFTTNPSLMKKAGITDYVAFAKDLLQSVPDRDISFEVFADDLDEMERQALEIGSWGKNVFVKIPVINTAGVFTGPILSRLSERGIQLNITALYTATQIRDVVLALKKDTPAVLSVFAGRMADAGTDPLPCVSAGVPLCNLRPNTGLLWASTREVWNVFQANDLGCEIITAPKDVIQKLGKLGQTPEEQTLETVKTFYEDASKAGFQI